MVGVVVRVPVAAVHVEHLRKGLVLHDRHADFAEVFVHGILAVQGKRRPALACTQGNREELIRVEGELLGAMLVAQRHADAALGQRKLPSVSITQVGSHVQPEHLLVGLAALEAGGLQVVERSLRHASRLEDVVRYALRVAAVDHRRAHGRAAGDRIRDDIQGLREALRREVVEVSVLVDDLAVLPPGIVVPLPVEEIALDADHEAVIGVTGNVLPSATLNVPAADEHGLGVAGRDVERRLERGRQQRIFEGERKDLAGPAEEHAARRDLQHGLRIHELEFRVHANVREGVVVRERVEEVALVGDLIVVVRTEVELVRRGVEGSDGAGGVGDREARGRAPVGVYPLKTPGKAGRGPQADKFLLRRGDRAGAEIAAALQDGVALLPFEVDRGVALAAGEVAAENHAEVLRLAIEADVARDAECRRVGLCAERHLRGNAGGIALLVVVAVAVPRELDAFEVVVHDEIHDPGNSVRSVDRRRTARQHVHALDQRGRNRIEVGRPEPGVSGGQPAAVDQDQRAARPEVAQVHRGGARCAVGFHLSEISERLGQLIDDVGDVGEAGIGDVLRGNDADRALALQGLQRNPRAGHRDLLNFFDRRRGWRGQGAARAICCGPACLRRPAP